MAHHCHQVQARAQVIQRTVMDKEVVILVTRVALVLAAVVPATVAQVQVVPAASTTVPQIF